MSYTRVTSDRRIGRVGQSKCILGEGPVWEDRAQRLFWVDIESRCVHSIAVDGSDHREWVVGEKISCIVPTRQSADFICGLSSHVAGLMLAPMTTQPIVQTEADDADIRCNDGKCDPAGRFWVGTCDQSGRRSAGYLYRLDAGPRLVRAAGPFICVNGPAFSPDGKILYCVDSYGRAVFAYDLDASGQLSRQRVLVSFEDPRWGFPDGLTCDVQGCIWVAHWGGGRISRFSAAGQLLDWITFPVSQVSSCTFGGPELDTLFVTSASLGLDPGKEPQAGGLFAVKVDVPGLPVARYG